MPVIRSNSVCVVRLLFSLVLVALAGRQAGGIRLMVEQVEVLGPRQWLGLVAGSFVPTGPITQRIATFGRRGPSLSA